MDKTFCVISHTHWDREWYFPFEMFRIKLLDLINHLFETLEEYPDYIFHLDAQTIVLEDYLEVYPENEERLKRYIKSGNIVIGPWYVQNDFFLSSAEATVRNLLIGKRIAKSFGKCTMAGYTPDQFGLPSQLPQILNQFGISTHLFGRGYTLYDKEDGLTKRPVPAESEWESPDGSHVFSVLMPYWYNNAQHISPEIDKGVALLENTEQKLGQWSHSPYLLLMNGVDHLEAQDDIIPIMEQLNQRLSGRKIVQMNMEEYLEKARPYAENESRKGELRYGQDREILTGTLSVRVDIKKQNFELQNMLEHQIEPLYAMLFLAGTEYPQNMLQYMWKKLIPNHAHDSICCCSNGRVMEHMKDRFLSLREMGELLIQRGCAFLNHHITREDTKNGEYYLTVVNTNQCDYSGVIDVQIDFAEKDGIQSFKIMSPDGKTVPYVVTNQSTTWRGVSSALNLPGSVRVNRYDIQMYADKIPAFGYVNYKVTEAPKAEEQGGSLLENEYLRIYIEQNKINIQDKLNRHVYADALHFEDVGDAGDSYNFVPISGDSPIVAKLTGQEIMYVNALKSKLKLTYIWDLPESSDAEGRSKKTLPNEICVFLSLGRGDKQVNIDVEIENQSKNHLVRAVIHTGINNTISYASSVYDIIKRDRTEIDTEIIYPTQPVNGFIYQKEDTKGLAIYTKGLYEYEHFENGNIALTLLRSVDKISDNPCHDWAYWGVEENLMIGRTSVSFAIMPFVDEEMVPAYEQNINAKPLVWFDSVDTRMFVAGKRAVQESEVEEVYVLKDKYEALKLPHTQQFISVNPRVCVSAFKKAERHPGVICRFYNPLDRGITDLIEEGRYCVTKTDLEEEKRESFDNTAEKKKIVSLYITTAE